MLKLCIQITLLVKAFLNLFFDHIEILKLHWSMYNMVKTIYILQGPHTSTNTISTPQSNTFCSKIIHLFFYYVFCLFLCIIQCNIIDYTNFDCDSRLFLYAMLLKFYIYLLLKISSLQLWINLLEKETCENVFSLM